MTAVLEDEGKTREAEDDAIMMEGIDVALAGVKKRNSSVENARQMSKKVSKMNKPPRRESDENARRKRRAADDGSGGNEGGEGGEVMVKTPDEVSGNLTSNVFLLILISDQSYERKRAKFFAHI